MREIEQPLKPYTILFTGISVCVVLPYFIKPAVRHSSHSIVFSLIDLSLCWIVFAYFRRRFRKRARPEWRVDEKGLTRLGDSGEDDKVISWSEIERITLTNCGVGLHWKGWGEENYSKRPLWLFLSKEDTSFIMSQWTTRGQSHGNSITSAAES